MELQYKTNMMLHVGFRLVLIYVTLNDLERQLTYAPPYPI